MNSEHMQGLNGPQLVEWTEAMTADANARRAEREAAAALPPSISEDEAKLLAAVAALEVTKEQLAASTKALQAASARAEKAEKQLQQATATLQAFETTVRIQAQVLPLR